MNGNPDKKFLNRFIIVMGSIVAATIGLFLLANFIADRTQGDFALEENAEPQKFTAQVEPVNPAEAEVAVVEDTAAAPIAEPVAAALSGTQVYNQACMACHAMGIAGAPKTGDAASWESRLSQGDEILREHVINGYQGSTGFMPAKGGRTDLSDDIIFAAMDYMLEQVR